MYSKKFLTASIILLAVVLVPTADAYPQNLPDEYANYSDEVPNGKIMNFNGSGNALFNNLMLQVDSSNSLQLRLTTSNELKYQSFSLDLEPGESLSLNMSIDVNPHGQTQRHTRSIGIYLEIEPNSTVDVNAKLKLYIDEEEIEEELGEDVDPNDLAWGYYNKSTEQWETVSSNIDENGYLVAETSHFSSWTIIDTSSDDEQGYPTVLIAGIVALIAVGAIGAIKMKK